MLHTISAAYAWSTGADRLQISSKKKKRMWEGGALVAVGRKKACQIVPRVIEFVRVPRHWFSDPLRSAMPTTVRPPIAVTRRKQQTIETKAPEEIFLDMMKPFETGDMVGFEWVDAERTALKPTKETKAYKMYKYMVKKPSLVDKL